MAATPSSRSSDVDRDRRRVESVIRALFRETFLADFAVGTAAFDISTSMIADSSRLFGRTPLGSEARKERAPSYNSCHQTTGLEAVQMPMEKRGPSPARVTRDRSLDEGYPAAQTPGMSDLASIARRIQKEVGSPAADAKRIARKLDKLASSVSWATSLSERDEERRKARVSTGSARRKTTKAHTAKKR